MITTADLTLPSGEMVRVEIHDLKSDSMGRIHEGKFKNTSPLSSQLNKEARLVGSWCGIREMKIQLTYRGSNYKLPILVDMPVQEMGSFQVIGDNQA
ncbi:hypothetical protein K6Q96_22700 [Grimontia kaedaensis]|uniref:Uncharacterized protein n=1 Tax=Grimontia kaedaensis TaxID=2872157 RepID=A0ABY4WZV8_9GAMM|nr:hypothetical protein [Grimontia kaedaensis]USH04538.1 hypothetical protein K6Q96_22700 [Grimontia kaedaensis]